MAGYRSEKLPGSRQSGGGEPLACMAMGEAGRVGFRGRKMGTKASFPPGGGSCCSPLGCSDGEERRSKAELGEQSEEFIPLQAAPALHALRSCACGETRIKMKWSGLCPFPFLPLSSSSNPSRLSVESAERTFPVIERMMNCSVIYSSFLLHCPWHLRPVHLAYL